MPIHKYLTVNHNSSHKDPASKIHKYDHNHVGWVDIEPHRETYVSCYHKPIGGVKMSSGNSGGGPPSNLAPTESSLCVKKRYICSGVILVLLEFFDKRANAATLWYTCMPSMCDWAYLGSALTGRFTKSLCSHANRTPKFPKYFPAPDGF
jgi:hypothetical protein